MTLPPDRRPVGTVEGVEVRGGLVHAWGAVWDSDAAVAMFGDGTNPPTLFPAVDLGPDAQVRLICDGEPYSYPDDYDDAMEAIAAGGVVMEFQAGTIMAVTLVDVPSWAGRVYFKPVVAASA